MSGPLDHSPADIIRSLLVAGGLGTEPFPTLLPWPVYAFNEPKLPDNCITVYGSEGIIHGRLMISGEVCLHHGIQVRIRSGKARDGDLKAHRIADFFDTETGRVPITLNAVNYLVHKVTRIGDVIPLGKEEGSERHLFTVNAIVAVRKIV